MSYKVLNDFMEKYHNNEVYRKGDTYPKGVFKTNQNRISFLQKVHPTYGVPFLDTPPEPKKTIAKRIVKSGDQ